MIRRKLRRILGIYSPAAQLVEQRRRKMEQLQLTLDAFGSGFRQGQIDAGQDPDSRAAEDARLRAVAAEYLNLLYKIETGPDA